MIATVQWLYPAQRVLASAPNGQVPLWGLTISHPEFLNGNGVDDPTSHYIINRPAPMTLKLEDGSLQDYGAAYFELALPKMDGKGQQDAQLSLQNVDRVIVDELENAMFDPSERIEVTIRLFLEDDPTAGPQNVPLHLSLDAVQANNQTVTGTAGRPDVLNRPFPAIVYRIDEWPGLDR